MKKQVFVLMWQDGLFVQRDDSTGPMSTGGYPLKAASLEDATQWESMEDAAAYAQICGWNEMRRQVYPVDIVLDIQAPIRYEERWTQCNHHCIETPESTDRTAAHFLDCPIWVSRFERTNR